MVHRTYKNSVKFNVDRFHQEVARLKAHYRLWFKKLFRLYNMDYNYVYVYLAEWLIGLRVLDKLSAMGMNRHYITSFDEWEEENQDRKLEELKIKKSIKKSWNVE